MLRRQVGTNIRFAGFAEQSRAVPIVEGVRGSNSGAMAIMVTKIVFRTKTAHLLEWSHKYIEICSRVYVKGNCGKTLQKQAGCSFSITDVSKKAD